MKIGIDPIIDCVFKKLFGSTENKNLSIALVNAILEEGGEKPVVDLEIVNPYNPKDFLRDKLSIVDIKAKDELGKWFIIEVQIQMMGFFPQRLLYYWAKTYQTQLRVGKNYSLLKKVTLISICKEALPINTQHYYNFFRILDVKNQVPLSDDLNIHTIELSKFPNTQENVFKAIEKWSYFLKHGENLDSENLPTHLSIPSIEQAAKELKMFTQTEIERELYESRHMAILDEMSSLAERYEKGLQKGKIEGIQEGIQKGEKGRSREIAIEMLFDGMDIKQIAKFSKLTEQEILILKTKFQK